MARYDVHVLGDGLALDVQADIVDMFETRAVIPLMPVKSVPDPLPRLHPVFTVDGAEYTLVTQFVSAVPRSVLRTPVANLSDQHDAITNALDMLFHGF